MSKSRKVTAGIHNPFSLFVLKFLQSMSLYPASFVLSFGANAFSFIPDHSIMARYDNNANQNFPPPYYGQNSGNKLNQRKKPVGWMIVIFSYFLIGIICLIALGSGCGGRLFYFDSNLILSYLKVIFLWPIYLSAMGFNWYCWGYS